MDGTCELERRLIAEQPGLEVKADENGRTVIRGYAAVFESESQDLGGFVEIVERGAFDEVMGSNPDVFGKYNHERVIGRTSSGTMRLMVDERGLRYEIDPPRSAADVVELIERGDVRGSSFAFRSKPADETWQRDAGGRMIRRIKKFSFLGDAGPVDTPAYMATETYVSKRALSMARAEPGSVKEGDFVRWDDGEKMGRVDHVMSEGTLNLGEVEMEATPDNEAALVTVWEDGEATDEQVAVRVSALTPVDAPEAEEEDERAVSLKPTAGMASAARRGLKLHEEGKSGDGLKPETVARANRLAKREEMNADWVREMNAWFSRHESASKSPGWNTPGDEKPGYVAWLLWGGDAAKNWSARKVKALESDRSLPEEPRITVQVSVDTTDFIGKIAGLKSALLRTHLHAK
jgi:HK97 family phage prohead protease